MTDPAPLNDSTREVRVQTDEVELEGFLTLPEGAEALVVFAHGSGSSRHSSRNRFVAAELNRSGLATLLFDLLTAEEERIDLRTRELRFDIELLARRVTGAVDWVGSADATRGLKIGLFGASTGAAAALMTAAERPDAVGAVVSRGGRPDLAEPALARVAAPTLLIVGGEDEPVIGMNRQAKALMTGIKTELEIVPGATHLFEEPGKLEIVSQFARDWFLRHL